MKNVIKIRMSIILERWSRKCGEIWHELVSDIQLNHRIQFPTVLEKHSYMRKGGGERNHRHAFTWRVPQWPVFSFTRRLQYCWQQRDSDHAASSISVLARKPCNCAARWLTNNMNAEMTTNDSAMPKILGAWSTAEWPQGPALLFSATSQCR